MYHNQTHNQTHIQTHIQTHMYHKIDLEDYERVVCWIGVCVRERDIVLTFGVATVYRIEQITGLFCRI